MSNDFLFFVLWHSSFLLIRYVLLLSFLAIVIAVFVIVFTIRFVFF